MTLTWYGPQGKRSSKQKPITLTASFFQGAAHNGEPTAADVLSSLLVDASVEDYGSFEDWAADLGYDPDSRKAMRTYRGCLKMAPRVRAFFGNDDEVHLEFQQAEH